MIIIIMGPVGSGKSTQSTLLAESLSAVHLSSGDLLYYASQGTTPQAQKIKVAMDRGEMVDQDLTIKLVNQYLEEHEGQDIIMDGYPRTVMEAESLVVQPDKVIYINVSDQESTKRLLARERNDDTLEIIEKRLKIYHEETEPILGFYRTRGVLEEINGEQTVKEIEEEIRKKTAAL